MLRLSWKYYARGLHGNLIISLSCKTKYHQKHKIYFPANRRSKILWLQTFYAHNKYTRPYSNQGIEWIRIYAT